MERASGGVSAEGGYIGNRFHHRGTEITEEILERKVFSVNSVPLW
jgi:hypothetical protein